MSDVELFCPWCAEPLHRIDGWLRCTAGDMELSQYMEKVLRERFGQHLRRDAPKPATPPALATWFCPACRVPLGDDLSCEKCRQTLFDVRYHLVEFHPHRRSRL